MSLNKPKSYFPVQTGNVAPQSIPAAGTAVTGWIDASEAHTIALLVLAGALGGGTVTVTWEQANTAAGGGNKAVFAASAGFAVDNAESWLEHKVEDMDINGGFRWVQAKLTNVGGAGALIAAAVFSCKS